jgi:hypothetical protein
MGINRRWAVLFLLVGISIPFLLGQSGTARRGKSQAENDTRYVNVDGDTMTGALDVPGLTYNSYPIPYILDRITAKSHTGDTKATTVATITVPANALDSNGALELTYVWVIPIGSIDGARIELKWDNSVVSTQIVGAYGSGGGAIKKIFCWNQGATNSQKWTESAGTLSDSFFSENGSSAIHATQETAADTTKAVNIDWVFTLDNAADTVYLYYAEAVVRP